TARGSRFASRATRLSVLLPSVSRRSASDVALSAGATAAMLRSNAEVRAGRSAGGTGADGKDAAEIEGPPGGTATSRRIAVPTRAPSFEVISTTRAWFHS